MVTRPLEPWSPEDLGILGLKSLSCQSFWKSDLSKYLNLSSIHIWPIYSSYCAEFDLYNVSYFLAPSKDQLYSLSDEHPGKTQNEKKICPTVHYNQCINC